MGYCLVVTDEGILGAKKRESMGDFEAYLGPGGDATDESRAEARRIAGEVAKHKEFLVPRGSIGQVLFKKPGMFSGGYAIIKTGSDSIRIDMTVVSTNSPFIAETSEKLENALETLAGERFQNVRGLVL